MRLNFLASALAGSLLVGWAAGATAAPAPPAPPAAPPAEPIFYCPAAPGHADAKHVAKHAGAGRHACPRARVAHAEHGHHWRGHETRFAARDGRGVSASQAFIYRYELRHDGFDAHAADGAWADVRRPGHDMGPPMGPPMVMRDHMGPLMAGGPGMRGGGHYGYLDERGGAGHWSGGEVRGHVWSMASERSWGGHGFRPGDSEWRDGSYGEVVEYAGRDAHGYLVWPGKTPQPDPIPDPDR